MPQNAVYGFWEEWSSVETENILKIPLVFYQAIYYIFVCHAPVCLLVHVGHCLKSASAPHHHPKPSGELQGSLFKLQDTEVWL